MLDSKRSDLQGQWFHDDSPLATADFTFSPRTLSAVDQLRELQQEMLYHVAFQCPEAEKTIAILRPQIELARARIAESTYDDIFSAYVGVLR
mgnify:CR=1 FL=1